MWKRTNIILEIALLEDKVHLAEAENHVDVIKSIFKSSIYSTLENNQHKQDLWFSNLILSDQTNSHLALDLLPQTIIRSNA